jgi:hypothetical protein
MDRITPHQGMSAYDRNKRVVAFFDRKRKTITPRDQETLERMAHQIYLDASEQEQKQIDFYMAVRARKPIDEINRVASR